MIEPRPPADGSQRDESRRGFIRGSSLLLAGALPTAAIASVAGSIPRTSPPVRGGELKIGLIGCGYRGIAAASELLNAASIPASVRLTALADAFPDRLQQALRTLRGRFGERVNVAGSARFVGLQAFQQLLATDVDVVLLATPPLFRPLHFEAAVASKKHVYAETPIAIDVPGLDRFQLALSSALEQRMTLAVGLAHRHQQSYQLTIDRLRRGAIGQILSAQVLQPSFSRIPAAGPKVLSDFESQLRRWSEHPWASGGSLVERRVRGLDVVNWLLDSHPLEARSLDCPPSPDGVATNDIPGVSLQPVEFTYAGGVTLRCESVAGNRASGKGPMISIQGAAGWCDLTAGAIFNSHHELVWRADQELAELPRPHDTAARAAPPEPAGLSPDFKHCNQWDEFLSAIITGEGFSQGAAAIESTRTAILGRMASMGRKRVTWQECLHSSEVFDGIACSPSTLALTAIR